MLTRELFSHGASLVLRRLELKWHYSSPSATILLTVTTMLSMASLAT